MVKKFHLERPQFKKIERQIHGGLTKISHGLSKAGDNIQKGARVGEKVLGSIQTVAPILEAGAIAYNPELAPLVVGGALLAGQGKQLAHSIKKIGQNVSEAGNQTNPTTIKNNIQRAKPQPKDDDDKIKFYN